MLNRILRTTRSRAPAELEDLDHLNDRTLPSWPSTQARFFRSRPYLSSDKKTDALVDRIKAGLQARSTNHERLARQLPSMLASPAHAKRATLQLSSADRGFQEAIQAGDKARDNRDWAGAEASFRQALIYYPLHSGYIVQYGHMIKERMSFAEAEVQYRHAIALGEPLKLVIEHLEFVARKNESRLSRGNLEKVAAYWLGSPHDHKLAPPSAQAVRTGIRLFLNREATPHEVCRLLDECSSRAEMISNLIKHPGFSAAHRRLLRMMAEINWGAEN